MVFSFHHAYFGLADLQLLQIQALLQRLVTLTAFSSCFDICLSNELQECLFFAEFLPWSIEEQGGFRGFLCITWTFGGTQQQNALCPFCSRSVVGCQQHGPVSQETRWTNQGLQDVSRGVRIQG